MPETQEQIGLALQGRSSAESPANASDTADELLPVTQRRQVLILLSSFLTICITIGFNQSYGVFQSYYNSSEQDMLSPEAQSQGALIAFVGTLGAGLTWGGSIVVNPLMARVTDVRVLTVTGVVCMSAGFGLASLGTQVSEEGFLGSRYIRYGFSYMTYFLYKYPWPLLLHHISADHSIRYGISS